MNNQNPQNNLASSSKSSLARLLAKENITIRHVSGASTASFNVMTRVLELPIWKDDISEDLYDMLVIHEVGHALDTDSKIWILNIDRLGKKHCPPGKPWLLDDVKSSIHTYVNVLEDIRIDKNQRDRYPGSKRNYAIGYKELYDKNFFNTEGKNLANLSFIDRLNLNSKAGYSGIYIPFSEEEKKILHRANNTKTLEDVIALAEEIWLIDKRIFENAKNNQNSENEKNKESRLSPNSPKEKEKNSDKSDKPGKEKTGDKSDNDKSVPGDNDTANDELEKDSSEGSDGDGEDEFFLPPEAFDRSETEENPDSENQADTNKNNTHHFGGVTGGAKQKENFIPRSETSEALSNSLETLIDKNAHGYYYSVIPEITNFKFADYKKVIAQHREYQKTMPLKDYVYKDVNKFRIDEGKSISFMVKEFEMRKAAESYSKTNISKTGVINTNKLHSYTYNDDIFKRNLTEQKGKNHGFVMFIDNSSSMRACFQNTLKQLYSLIMFCKRIQVPFEVYSFTSGGYYSGVADLSDYSLKFASNPENLQLGDRAKIRNIFSSKMKQAELDFMMNSMLATYLYDKENDRPSSYTPSFEDKGGTPLNETILAAEILINQFKKKNNVEICNVIFLTDGEGSPPTLGANLYTSKTNSYNIVIQDKKTKNEYVLPHVQQGRYTYYNTGFDWTNLLLKVLKDRTNCNLIGFYIIDTGSSWTINSVLTQGRKNNQIKNDLDIFIKNSKAELLKNGYTEIKGSGYDEYFLISKKAMDTNTRDFEIENAAEKTVSKIGKEFSKFLEKKVNNRKLLTTFIKKIA